MTASYNKALGVSHVHHVQGSALAMWRASIRRAANDAGATKVATPVGLMIVFGIRRPKSQMILRGGKYLVRAEFHDARPAVAPDIDKLTRAVMDALTNLCYYDDRQVVALVVIKKYGETTKIEVSDEFHNKHPQLSFGMV
jgi:Holliday junction resolvase RusA-like endonuclease